MQRSLLYLGLVALLVWAAESRAQVTARSYSDGGVATARASGVGRTHLHADASASRGGRADARITGSGLAGGRASGTSIAVADRGRAISRGQSDAYGHRARSHVDSVAAASRGVAVSRGNAFAEGRGEAISRSTAIGNRGRAVARSDADARGDYGGRSLAESEASEAVADAYRGRAFSNSRVQAYATDGGRATGRGEAIGLGWGRSTRAGVQVDSRAAFGGRSRAAASHLNW